MRPLGFSIFLNDDDGRWLIYVDGVPGPGATEDPYDDLPSWPSCSAALDALRKWAGDRGLALHHANGTSRSLNGRVERAS